jgi:DNA-binding CsgD family transcriptional regulator/tetratricopeptide (TPR) repeat protein
LPDIVHKTPDAVATQTERYRTAGRRPLRGRQDDLERVLDCTRQAAETSTSRVVVVRGEPGIGKSRLFEEIRAEIDDDDDWQVIWVAPDDVDQLRPFGALADALGSDGVDVRPEQAAVARALADASTAARLDASGPGEAPQAWFGVLEAMLGLVEALACEGPLLVGVDDLHLLDPSSLLALSAVSRRVTGLPVVLACATRPTPTFSDAGRLVSDLVERGATMFELGPLMPPAVDQLVADIRPGLPAEATERVQDAGGNPLFVIALVTGFGEFVVAGEPDGHSREPLRELADSSALSPRVRSAILDSLDFLGPEGIDALQVASVLGQRFSLVELGRLLGRPTGLLLRSVEGATRNGLLVEDGVELAFRHALIRDVIYQDLSPPVRTALHRDAAGVLAALGAPPVEVAHHLALSARTGDQEAIEWLRRAAGEVAPFAPVQAVELLRKALDWCELSNPERGPLLVELVAALTWSGHIDAAMQMAGEALSSVASDEMQTTLRLFLARALLANGQAATALDQLTIARALPDLPDHVRAELTAEAAFAEVVCGDPTSAGQLAVEAGELGTLVGNDYAVCSAWCTLAWVKESAGEIADALAYARAAVDRSEASTSVEARRFHVHLILAFMLVDADQINDALATLRTGRARCESLGSVWVLPGFLFSSAILLMILGDWDDAEAEARSGLALADELGTRQGTVVGMAILAMLASRRGDRTSATERLCDAEKELARTGPQAYGHWLLWAQAMIEESRGDTDAAFASVESLGQVIEAFGIHFDRIQFGPDMTRIALAAGHTVAATEITAGVEEIANRAGTATARASALRCRGMLTADADMLVESVGVLRSTGRTMEVAAGCEEAAVALVGAGRGKEAVPFAEEAMGIYDSAGANMDLQRVAALGLTKRRRARETRTGWDSLTPTEARVVECVAKGMSNRAIADKLFVSRRTIETHVAHVFDKLGLSSRAQLAGEAVGRAAATGGRRDQG